MKQFITLAFILFTFSSAFSQSGSISGKITDTTGRKPLALATITVFKAKDTTIVTYRLSNDAGEFKIPGLPFGIPLRFLATFSGYKAFRKDFTLTADAPTIPFGNLKMAETAETLDEMIVTAERPPVVFKKDTIEFNASAFKTLPTALLEDLLKKLPGVLVDANGDLTYNGRKVNRLLVGGKRFFGDDPKMATRNLPSNLIDKIQVVDDKEELAQNNDGDLSKIGTVFNITLKKEVKKAVFGKLNGAIGTNDRYEVGGIINTFRDTLQLSILGFSNNVNRSSFNIRDVSQLGGFDRSGYNSIGIYKGQGGEGFAINNISFGGANAGLSRILGAGFNLNHAPSKNLSFFGQYFYGNNRTVLEQETNTQRFFGDTVVNTRSVTNPITTGNSHTLSGGGNWKPDTLTNIGLNIGFNHTDNGAVTNTAIATNNNKLGGLVNNLEGNYFVNGDINNYNHSFSFTRRAAKKKGRQFSLYQNLNYNSNPVNNITETINNYLYPTSSAVYFQQLRTTNSPSTTASLNASYSDPLSKLLTLRINERYEYTKNVQDVVTFGRHAGSSSYDSLNIALSNDMAREQTRWSSNVVFSYRINKVTMNAGTTLLQQWINNSFSVAGGTANKQSYTNLLFGLSANWKRFSFGFSQDVNPVYITYLLPVPDNSNPFFIVYGNPNLKPSSRNGIYFNGTIANPKKNTSFFIYSQFGITDNAVIQSVQLNSNGVQVNTPVNVNGVLNSSMTIRFTKQYKNRQKFSFTPALGASGSVNRSPILFNNEYSRSTTLNGSVNAGFTLNWDDVIEFNPSYNPNFSKSFYTSKSFNNTDIVTQNLQGEFILRLPKKFVWETNIAYRSYAIVAPGLPHDNIYWNAAVTFLMFKQDKGQLKLSVYDILNSNNSVTRYFNGNAIIDSRMNVLQRYFMLSYSYNIRSLAKDKPKVGGRQNMFLF